METRIRALVVRKEKNKKPSVAIETIDNRNLPEGDVLVEVAYSTVNFKDGLCMDSGAGLVRTYPHVPGIDFSGTVIESTDKRFSEGDQVILTGWRVGEERWGGYAQQASVKAEWLVPLPKGFSLRQSMVVGTAGLAAMLGIMALEKQGLNKSSGPVLVTGASGGVGSVAIAILSSLGYEVSAVTGRGDLKDYVKELGASFVLDRKDFNVAIKRPLENQIWGGCIDAVGGDMLARVLGQLKYASSVASIGNVGGNLVPASVIPFLLRGINILGIDSATQHHTVRVEAWNRIVSALSLDKLSKIMVPATINDLAYFGKRILKGDVRGRVVVDMQK